jgi:tRNA pseudouridine32 synthase/23S rRNA pseudouridine746 synthase
MAMFWWGESPKTEVRHHLQCYPACNGKCKPILWWMLQGLDVAPNPLDDASRDAALAARLRTLYDDADICVVSKPAGLLAVPGKSGRESVLSLMRRRFPDAPSPLIVHRLDMDTSGLMVIAKTMAAYHDLQRQFAAHTIQKRYVAIVEGQPKRDEGVISLPLRPDLDDRPRQVVDPIHGRPALTIYHVVARFDDGRSRLWLYPHTGRTHQLRVHCAHADGLGCPIVGDALYGSGRLIQGDVRCGSGRLIQGDVRCGSGRLCLHAEQLTFRHPTTGRTMTFTDKPPF